jgi:hypothetical protein
LSGLELAGSFTIDTSEARNLSNYPLWKSIWADALIGGQFSIGDMSVVFGPSFNDRDEQFIRLVNDRTSGRYTPMEDSMSFLVPATNVEQLGGDAFGLGIFTKFSLSLVDVTVRVIDSHLGQNALESSLNKSSHWLNTGSLNNDSGFGLSLFHYYDGRTQHKSYAGEFDRFSITAANPVPLPSTILLLATGVLLAAVSTRNPVPTNYAEKCVS